jgi:hypothetical protein
MHLRLASATAAMQGPPARSKQDTLDPLLVRAQPNTSSLYIRTDEQQNVSGLVEVWHNEQATSAPDSVCKTAADNPNRSRISELSPRELLEHLEALKTEDVDLDGAPVDLRASPGDYQVSGPGRNSKSRLNPKEQQQHGRHVVTRDSPDRAATEISCISISSAPSMSTGLNLKISGTPRSAPGACPGAVPSARTVATFNVLEAEQALREFDCSTRWGPAFSLTRFKRLARRRALPEAPPGWEWVDDILRRFPALGNLTAAEKYRGGVEIVSAVPAPSVQNLPAAYRIPPPGSDIPGEKPASGNKTLASLQEPALEARLLHQRILAPGETDHMKIWFLSRRPASFSAGPCFSAVTGSTPTAMFAP